MRTIYREIRKYLQRVNTEKFSGTFDSHHTNAKTSIILATSQASQVPKKALSLKEVSEAPKNCITRGNFKSLQSNLILIYYH